jgi:diaminopimelate epimerase
MIELVKLHGLGNDFLVSMHEGSPDLARAACHRHTGVGADGLILGGRTDSGELTFRLWNADGGEAEMSGNGVRCLAHAALDAGWVAEAVPFGVLTPAGRRRVSIRRTGPGATWGVVDMGPVKVGADADDVCNVGHGSVLVDVGNPHLVVLGPDPRTVDVAGLGARLERSDPAGLNVEFVTLGPEPDSVTMRVWERGVGETLACGTGSVAVAAALRHWGRVGTAVTVHQPGGSAAVELRPDGTATLAGPSVRVATCDYWAGSVIWP